MSYVKTKLPDLEFSQHPENDVFFSGLERMAKIDRHIELLRDAQAHNVHHRSMYYLAELAKTTRICQEYLHNLQIAENPIRITDSNELIGAVEWDPRNTIPFQTEVCQVSVDHAPFRRGDFIVLRDGKWGLATS